MEARDFETSQPVAGFAAVWRAVVSDPRTFYAGLSPSGGFEGPLVFAAGCLAIGGFEVLLFGGGLRGMVLLVLLGLVRLTVGSAILVLVARKLYGGRGDYEATFRAVGYSSAAAVAIGVPFFRYFAALYGAYLTVLGVARAQGFDEVRATLTVAGAVLAGFLTARAVGASALFEAFDPLLH